MLQSKLPQVGVTIFTRMTQLANKYHAYNLSQGFPEFDVPSELMDLVEKYVRTGNNQYAPMQGVYELREQIAKKAMKLYGAEIDPDEEVTITSGATEALYAAITAVVHHDDEVIIIEPAYDSYLPAVQLNGGRPICIEMIYPDYHIDWDKVADAISDKTRLIILNTPHNPTGTMLMPEDIMILRDIISHTPAYILSDEVYEHIIFDGQLHHSLLKDPELSSRSFVISSFGKTYHATGWKIGYCIAPPPLTKELRRIHQFLTFSSPTPIQMAFAEFMDNKDIYRELPLFYQQKRDRFLSFLKNSPFKALQCLGTYFLLLDYSSFTDAPDIDFARKLTIDYGVASIPISVFYNHKTDNKVLRFCFAKNDDTLRKAAEILCKI
jgi:methionine aminotransferase